MNHCVDQFSAFAAEYWICAPHPQQVDTFVRLDLFHYVGKNVGERAAVIGVLRIVVDICPKLLVLCG